MGRMDAGVGWRLAAFTLMLGAVAVGPGCDKDDGDGEPTFIPAPGTPAGEETEVEGARSYTFSDAKSLIYVQVYAVPGTAGHDHVMRATGYQGTMVFDTGDVSSCEVDVSLAVEDLKADEDAMRDLVGYSGHLSDNEKKSVTKNMLDSDQLDVDSFPRMAFKSTGCEDQGDGVVRMSGDLTIHGTTRGVTVELATLLTTEGLFADGSFRFKHTEFGIEPYKLFNSYENADEIKMTLSIQGVPAE